MAQGVTHELDSFLFASIQYKLFSGLHEPIVDDEPIVDAVRKKEAEICRRLEKVRFKFDFGNHETGHCKKYFCRGSG